MGKKTYHIQTFGCQMNEHDSETLAGMLSLQGYEENSVRNQADVIIINTCSVREHADKRFFGTLGQLKHVKAENPEKIIALCGCMMQQQHVIQAILTKYPWVDLVFGTHNLHEFPELMTNLRNDRSRKVAVWDEASDIIEGLPTLRKYPFKAYVTIMYGCNNFCSYCIVPYTRGRERSRDPEEILKEVRTLVSDGVKEITLLGQNVNSYRGKLGEMDFTDLIYALNEIDGLERIRFMTSHPKDLSDRLIQAYVDCPKLCHHIHLPVQSGSTAVLKRMNRIYTKEYYLSLIEKLRALVPDMAITTDIIVGFPGETEEDFLETLDLVNRVRYDSAYTFLYSIRQGTPAEGFGNQIPETTKHERFNRLIDAVNLISAEKNREMIGQTALVLVEGKSKTNLKAYTGRTGGHKLVNFHSNIDYTGQIVSLVIKNGNTFSLVGEITENHIFSSRSVGHNGNR